MRRRLPVLLLAIACAVATVVAVAPFRSFSHPPWHAVAVDVLVGLSFVLVGAVAWLRRPDYRTGVLMAAVGFAWFLPDVFWLDVPSASKVAQFFEFFYAVILAQLFMTFPTGRLSRRRERVLVGGLYLWWLTTSVVGLLLYDPQERVCPGCPLNLVPVDRDGVFRLLNLGPHLRRSPQWTELGMMALFLLVLVVVVIRWRRATSLGRRALGPVFWASFPALALVIALELGAARFSYPLVPFLWWWGPAALVALPALFLVGLLRTRLAHSAVSRLMVKLGDHPPPGRLQQALAETLRDPSVELAYWLPDKASFVDGEGNPVELAARGGRAVQMLEHDGERVAALVMDASLQEEPGLVDSVAAAARLAVVNERLHAQVRAQLEEVRAQRIRLLETIYETRRKIERDLHDGAQQRFVAVLLALRSAQLHAGGDPGLQRELDRVAAELRGAVDELRNFVQGIYPPILTSEGLRAALLSLAERTPLAVELSVPEGRYPDRVEGTAYLVVSEALTNVAKHAEASRAEVVVTESSGCLVVRVEDDGRGGADSSLGSGLHGLIERVAALDGQLRIDSPPGRGTRIVAEIPCS